MLIFTTLGMRDAFIGRKKKWRAVDDRWPANGSWSARGHKILFVGRVMATLRRGWSASRIRHWSTSKNSCLTGIVWFYLSFNISNPEVSCRITSPNNAIYFPESSRAFAEEGDFLLELQRHAELSPIVSRAKSLYAEGNCARREIYSKHKPHVTRSIFLTRLRW